MFNFHADGRLRMTIAGQEMRVDEILQLLQYRRNGGWIGYLGTPAGRAEVAHGDMPCRIAATSGGGVVENTEELLR